MKKHISPKSAFIALITFSTFTCIYGAEALSYGSGQNTWSISLLVIGVVCILIQAYITFIHYGKKNTIDADEYTTGIQNRSAYYSFIIISFLICMLFIGIEFYLIDQPNAASLSQLLDVRIVLGLLAVIQLIGVTSFTSLYFYFDKRGNN